MNRRSLLLGLLAAPLAPVAVKAAPARTIGGTLSTYELGYAMERLAAATVFKPTRILVNSQVYEALRARFDPDTIEGMGVLTINDGPVIVDQNPEGLRDA